MEEKRQQRKNNNAIKNFFEGFPIRNISLKDYVGYITQIYSGKDIKSENLFKQIIYEKYLLTGDSNLRKNATEAFNYILYKEGSLFFLFALAFLTKFVDTPENRSLIIKLENFLKLGVFDGSKISIDMFNKFLDSYSKFVGYHFVNFIYPMLGLKVYQNFYNICYSQEIIDQYIKERRIANLVNDNDYVLLDNFFYNELPNLKDENMIRDRLYEIYRYGFSKGTIKTEILRTSPVRETISLEPLKQETTSFAPKRNTRIMTGEFIDDTAGDIEHLANLI